MRFRINTTPVEKKKSPSKALKYTPVYQISTLLKTVNARLSDLYGVVEKTESKSDIITSALVNCDGIPARIVFVRNRHNKREWLAILSTDITISEEEIIGFTVCVGTLKSTSKCANHSWV
jgi:hypothetical protein